MRAVPVVVMLPLGQHHCPLGRVVVGDAVGPLAQCALDEALGLAVGLGPVGAGALVHDAQRGVVGHRRAQEGDSASLALVRLASCGLGHLA